MCGLCGLFEGQAHWSELAGDDSVPARQARQLRVAVANRVLRHYRLSLSDWQGHAYLLSGPTGATEVLDSIAALWPAAERLLGRACDPLDPNLLAALQQDQMAGR